MCFFMWCIVQGLAYQRTDPIFTVHVVKRWLGEVEVEFALWPHKTHTSNDYPSRPMAWTVVTCRGKSCHPPRMSDEEGSTNGECNTCCHTTTASAAAALIRNSQESWTADLWKRNPLIPQASVLAFNFLHCKGGRPHLGHGSRVPFCWHF